MGTIGTTFSELYFHELDTRDRIFARLQLNYAIYASAIAMLAYMARMVDYSTPCIYLSFFMSALSQPWLYCYFQLMQHGGPLQGTHMQCFQKPKKCMNMTKNSEPIRKQLRIIIPPTILMFPYQITNQDLSHS